MPGATPSQAWSVPLQESSQSPTGTGNSGSTGRTNTVRDTAQKQDTPAGPGKIRSMFLGMDGLSREIMSDQGHRGTTGGVLTTISIIAVLLYVGLRVYWYAATPFREEVGYLLETPGTRVSTLVGCVYASAPTTPVICMITAQGEATPQRLPRNTAALAPPWAPAGSTSVFSLPVTLTLQDDALPVLSLLVLYSSAYARNATGFPGDPPAISIVGAPLIPVEKETGAVMMENHDGRFVRATVLIGGESDGHAYVVTMGRYKRTENLQPSLFAVTDPNAARYDAPVVQSEWRYGPGGPSAGRIDCVRIISALNAQRAAATPPQPPLGLLGIDTCAGVGFNLIGHQIVVRVGPSELISNLIDGILGMASGTFNLASVFLNIILVGYVMPLVARARGAQA